MAPSDLLTLQRAVGLDVSTLVAFNAQLIEDQGHDNSATLPELEQRMRRWLAGQYEVVLIELDDEPVAYAVWRDDDEDVYLRQFFVARDRRRSGIGRAAFVPLDHAWRGRTVKLNVLLHNDRALAFYRALGFRDYSLVLRRLDRSVR